MRVRSSVAVLGWVLLCGCQAQPAALQAPEIGSGWFVPQGPRVATLGEISSRRQVIDPTHRSTEILFLAMSGPVIPGEQRSVAAVKLTMRIDCAASNYVITQHVLLSEDGEALQTTAVNNPDQYGPMDLIVDEVCGGEPPADKREFLNLGDYISKAEDIPRPAPIPGRISRP